MEPGRALGLIGRNGSGKSSLLRLIGQVGRPDEGQVQTQGRIGALLDLGANFHPELTGRENVFVSGIVAGLTRRQVQERFEAIVAFAELEDFIDSPLRTYSTGMQMRLAFAVAVHTDPQLLLIDEVLAVGDISFQQKCLERIQQFKSEGCTIVYVSHDLTSVTQLCDEVIWLNEGQIMAHNSAEAVVEQYLAAMRAETQRRTPANHPAITASSGLELRVNENRFGSLEMEITAVHLLNPDRSPVAEFDAGRPLQIEIEYLAPQPIPTPIFGITISRDDGLACYETTTAARGLLMPILQGRGRVRLTIDRLDLNGGLYFVDAGIYERTWAYTYDYHWHVYPLTVRPGPDQKGVLQLPHRWEVSLNGSQ
jgi:lipopolysaccharide transport system ATP-binding protein